MQDSDSPKLWFIRHAESEANVRRIYDNGESTFGLTSHGLEQAKAIARSFSSLAIRSVYTSPILRAMQTAQEICITTNKEMQIAPELSEYNMGIYEGTSSLPGTPGAISDKQTKSRWYDHHDYDARSLGGESLNDMKLRFLPFVRRVAENQEGDAGIVLLITHGGILAALLPFVFENLSFNFVQSHPIDHLCIIKGKLKHGRFHCVEYDSKPALEFSPPGSFTALTDMTGGGPFGLKPGEWTDDTSMALCLAESLIERNGFDAKDQMDRYCRWYERGHLSSTGRCFDTR